MTPQQRRAKYPLAPVTPMTPGELGEARQRASEWLTTPTFTSDALDRLYHGRARLLATLDATVADAKRLRAALQAVVDMGYHDLPDVWGQVQDALDATAHLQEAP